MANIIDFIRKADMNKTVHASIPELFEVARDSSDVGHVRLVEKLAEVFLNSSAALTIHETRLVNDLIADLLAHGSPEVRQALIKRFSQAIHATRDVAVRVVHGPIEIARPALIENAALTDADLITVIDKKGPEHAAAIASRRKINEAVADALVTTGDLRVMQIVAENLGAKLSGKAFEILVDSARMASLLQRPLLTRPELNPETAIKLFWWVSQELRRDSLERYGFGPGKLEMALDKATDDILTALLLQKDDDASMYHLANWLEERGALETELLSKFLRMQHYRLFSIALSRLSQLDLKTVDQMNNSGNSRMLVVVCRAIGVEKTNFVSIFLMSRGGRKDEQVVHPQELSQALEAFDKLDPNMAKAMVECWRVNLTPTARSPQNTTTDRVYA